MCETGKSQQAIPELFVIKLSDVCYQDWNYGKSLWMQLKSSVNSDFMQKATVQADIYIYSDPII